MEKEEYLKKAKRLNKLIEEYKVAKGRKRDEIFKDIYGEVKYVVIALKTQYSGFTNIDIHSLALEGLFTSLSYYDTQKYNKLRFPRFFGTFLRYLIISNYYHNRMIPLPHDLASRKTSKYTNLNNTAFQNMKSIRSSDIKFGDSDHEIYPLTDKRFTPETLIASDKQIAKQMTNIILDKLTPRERYLVESFYGVNRPKKTLVKMGKEYNVSRERIRQLIVIAKNKIWAKYKNMNNI